MVAVVVIRCGSKLRAFAFQPSPKSDTLGEEIQTASASLFCLGKFEKEMMGDIPFRPSSRRSAPVERPASIVPRLLPLQNKSFHATIGAARIVPHTEPWYNRNLVPCRYKTRCCIFTRVIYLYSATAQFHPPFPSPGLFPPFLYIFPLPTSPRRSPVSLFLTCLSVVSSRLSPQLLRWLKTHKVMTQAARRPPRTWTAKAATKAIA